MKYIPIILLFFFSISGFAQELSRGSTATKIEKADTGVKRAVIVGISNYKEEKLKLNYAENDAALFREYLNKVERIPEEQISYLTDNNAVSLEITHKLQKLLADTQTGDTAYIYFAGHGDVIDDMGGSEGFLLASDANSHQEYNGTGGVIPLEYLNKCINAITKKGGKVVLVLDACHSGFLFKEGTQKNLQVINTNFQNATKFLSCKPEQLSYESKDLAHGYFTYYLVLGLMGAADNIVADHSIQYFELANFLDDNVKKETDQKQEPVIFNQNITDVFKPTVMKDQEEALAILKKSSKLNDVLASRGISTSNSNPNLIVEKNPIVEQFDAAMEHENYYGSDQSAYNIYLSALKDNKLSKELNEKMKYSLIKVLSTNAQLLINKYIGEPETLPSGKVFNERAKQLDICLELLDKDAFGRDRIYTSKLFLEAYAIISNKNFSNYKLAKAKLLEAIEIQPKAAYIHNALGLIYSDEEAFDDAFNHYNAAKELIPSWALPLNNMGVLFDNNHKNEEAKAYYNQALKLSGYKNDIYNNLGVVYHSEGKYALAEECYKKSLETDSNNINALRNLGIITKEKGNIKQSKEWFDKAMIVDSLNNFVEYGLKNYIDEFKIENTKAEKLLKNAIHSEPYFANVYSEYADFIRDQFNQPERMKQADSLYVTAIKNNPHYIWAYAGRAWLFHSLNDEMNAEASFEKGIEVNSKKPKSYYNFGNYYKNGVKNIVKAEVNYLKAIELDAYYLPAYKELIDLYNNNNQQDQSIELLRKIVKLNPEAPDLWNLTGNTYFSKQDFKNAITAYKEAIKIDSTYAMAYANLSYAQLQEGFYQESEANYERANFYNPYKNKLSAYADLLLSTARANAQNKNNNMAKKLLEAAYRMAPAVHTGFQLSEFYYLNQEPKAAFQTIIKTLIGNDSPTWNVKLLELALKIAIENNDTEKAADYFNQLKTTNSVIDELVQVMYYQATGKVQEASDMIKKINPLQLKQSYLASKYSAKAIQLIQK